MEPSEIKTFFNNHLHSAVDMVSNSQTYIQLLVIVLIYTFSFLAACKVRRNIGLTYNIPSESSHPLRKFAYRVGGILFPLLAIILLQVSRKIGESLSYSPWLLETALLIAVLLFFNSLIRIFVAQTFTASLFRWIGLPILSLNMLDL